jgi:hypothetical protein
MSKLQVENLETRQMLTGAGFPAALLPASLLRDGSGDRILEHPLRVDANRLVGPAERDWQGVYEVELGLSGSFVSFSFAAQGQEVSVLCLPFALSPGAAKLEWAAGDALRAVSDHWGAGHGVSRDLATARGNGGGSLPPPPGPANSYGGPSGPSPADDRFFRADRATPGSPGSFLNAAGPAGGRADPQGLPALGFPVAPAAGRIELQGFPAAGSPAWETRSRDVLFALVPSLGDRSSEHHNDGSGIWPVARAEAWSAQPSPQPSAVPSGHQPFDFSGMELGMKQFLERLEGLLLPSGQVSDVLTVLPPLDVSSLELGMREFLDELEGVGQRLTGVRGGTGAYAWVVAVATAAMACEIARRQLRSASGGAGEINNLTGFEPDRLFLR